MKTFVLTIAKIILLVLIGVLIGFMAFGKADPLCKEANRLRDTETTHERWLVWTGKPDC